MGAQKPSPAEIESVICSLTSVHSAKVVADKSNEIQEIHVLTDTSRSPKQLVRDVESALQAQFGLELDHKKVSIAQTQNGKSAEKSKSTDPARLKLSDVFIALNGSQAEALVRLRMNGSSFEGQSTGHSSSHSQFRLIASATLKAIEGKAGENVALVLEDLNATVNLSGHQVVVVFVNMISPKGEEQLTGSAIVKQDIWKAVVNATLDAVNRRLGTICEQ